MFKDHPRLELVYKAKRKASAYCKDLKDRRPHHLKTRTPAALDKMNKDMFLRSIMLGKHIKNHRRSESGDFVTSMTEEELAWLWKFSKSSLMQGGKRDKPKPAD